MEARNEDGVRANQEVPHCRHGGSSGGASTRVVLCSDRHRITLGPALEALQAALIGPVAHSLIAMSFIGAVFAYAIAGDSEIARRLAKAGLGVSVGLVLLRLMNYLVP
jgi:hypothetical protein